MIPPRFKCYCDIDNKKLKRVRILIGGHYLFTLGLYKKEMGFFIDFPKFSSYTTNIDNCLIPSGVVKDFKITLKGDKKSICPKLSFHESGQVHFSKSGLFKGKLLVKNQTAKSIYENDGSHVLTIMMQNINKLEYYNATEKVREKNFDLPFDIVPQTIKFVGNLWKEEDLKKDFGQLYTLKNSELPLYWINKNNNIGDLTLILKFSHVQNPLYLTLRCIPIDILDPNEKNPLLVVMSGWKFEEMKDGINDAQFIGLIAGK